MYNFHVVPNNNEIKCNIAKNTKVSSAYRKVFVLLLWNFFTWSFRSLTVLNFSGQAEQGYWAGHSPFLRWDRRADTFPKFSPQCLQLSTSPLKNSFRMFYFSGCAHQIVPEFTYCLIIHFFEKKIIVSLSNIKLN